MNIEKLEKRISSIRLMSLIAVVASGAGSLLMYCIGAVKVFRAYQSFFVAEVGGGPAMSGSNLAISYVVQAIDAFLIAMVLMIFAGGIYNLFVHTVDESDHASHKLFRIRSIAELKRILAELVIIILMVKFLEEALHTPGGYQWEILVLPAGVLMLAAAVNILRLRGD